MERRRFLAIHFPVAAVSLLIFLIFVCDADAAFFEKEYVVREVQGEEILCDPYVVRSDDWVLRLFRQRGEIAHEDFPRFLELFKILNPDVEDIDTIYPNQEVLIPLRSLPPGSLEGQDTGSVTIPVITISRLPEIIAEHSTRYRVRHGDWVSKLISRRFGSVGSESYDRGMALFRKINPEIDNIDFIHAGQMIRLPEGDIEDTPLYAEMFDESDEMIDLTGVDPSLAGGADAGMDPEPVAEQSGTGPERRSGTAKAATDDAAERAMRSTLPLADRMRGFADLSIFHKAAIILDANVINSGEYYFPRSGRSDFRLVLSETPLMVFRDGTTILFTKREWLSLENQHVVELYWPDIHIVFFEVDTRLETLISTAIQVIDSGGFERQVDFRRDGLTVALRGQYIFESPGRFGTVCLNIIEKPEMRVPSAIRDYLQRAGFTVRDWVEGDNMSGWAADLEAGNYRTPEVEQVPAHPPARIVGKMARKMGHRYQEDVEISFPYAGFQVNATADMLGLDNGKEVLIDYGGLDGDAVQAIEKTGVRVIQFDGSGDFQQIVGRLAELLSVEVNADPIFWTSKRPRLYNPSIQIPGFLISPRPDPAQLEERQRQREIARQEEIARQWGTVRRVEEAEEETRRGEDQAAYRDREKQPELFVSMVPLPDAVAAHLAESGIRLIEIASPPGR